VKYLIATQLPQSAERRCAVNLNSTNLNIPYLDALSILRNSGLHRIEVNLLGEARHLIGKVQYARETDFSNAPHILNCITFIKYLYAIRGIWLPKDFLRWLEYGEGIAESELGEEDIVFTEGLFSSRPAGNLLIGHVGLMTNRNTVIHAGYRVGAQEMPRNDFFAKYPFSTARRLVPRGTTLLTYTVPSHLEIETSDDILYLIEKKWMRNKK